jgi:hypothetical protein
MKNIFTLVCAALFSCYAFSAFADENNESVNNESTTETVASVDEGCGCPKPQESGEAS